MNWYGNLLEKGASYTLKPVGDAIIEGLTFVGHTITTVMPEIGAGVVVICAVGMMLTGDIPKWIGRCAVGLGGAIIWLLNA
ncbi:hypothetical protein [Heyndrickxia oleronia]|uniref:Uncharacterized protein n=1 Tax=Heyndrickxia oleronia TaxID=38875 RepID=A0AAW6SNQ3_9BACI|nr:hypothetical protein [Heyndrickxia oleronia]MDH5159800.1 hypothetical protein [Heyndrickxia oleronia]